MIQATVFAVSAAALLSSLITISAQKPGAASANKSATPMCATLLTAEELSKAVVAGFQDMGAEEREPGASSCPWMLRGGANGFKTVNVEFSNTAYIKTTPNASTADKYFEMLVTAAEESNNKKREILPGIGQRAAFIAADPQVGAFVQRADGVARIVANGLTKAQITAVARAVATP